MKRYLINGLVLTAVMGAFTIAQERQAKPVTTSSLVSSVMRLSDKAEKAGLHRDAAILMDAAKTMLDKKIPVKAVCGTDTECEELLNTLRKAE